MVKLLKMHSPPSYLHIKNGGKLRVHFAGSVRIGFPILNCLHVL